MSMLPNTVPATYSTAIYSTVSLTALFLAYRFLTSHTTKLTPVPASEMKTIVILGGSYGGITTAHKLLKESSTTGSIKIILVAPNTHLYWNLASVRGIIAGQFKDEQLFQPIAPGFKQYPASRFEFIQGVAQSFDATTKKVTIATPTGSTTNLSYDILVLATGAKTNGDAPWKSQGTYEETRDRLHEYQEKVKKADSIVVVGSGATGVETAGELGFEHGKTKKIILIASGANILEGTPASVTKNATKLLQNVNVALKLSTKVTSDTKLADGRTELTLSSGEKLITDLYLPTMGILPNSSYIPSQFLSPSGYVVVDTYLRVKSAPDVWAVGDLSSIQRAQLVNTAKQALHAAKNIALIMAGKEPLIYKTGGADMLAVPVGRKAGVGHMGSWGLPSFMVHMAKGKTYFTEKLGKMVMGTA